MENQENATGPTPMVVATPKKGRVSLGVAEQVLDKLSLNSPLNLNSLSRSPLKLLNVASNPKIQSEDAPAPGSPKSLYGKRKVLSARAFGISRSLSLSKRDSGIYSLRDEGSNPNSCDGFPIPSTFNFDQGDQGDKSDESGSGPSFSAFADLLYKPILNRPLSPLSEERHIPRREKAGSTSSSSDLNTTPTKNNILGEAFKRPSPPSEDEEAWPKKRARSSILPREILGDLTTNSETAESDTTGSSSSKEEASAQKRESSNIKIAVERIDSDPNLVGDGSTWHVLPILENGKHKDLKEISPTTLIGLVNGDYKETIQSFVIVDCRYPYEYTAGHIKGAINLHTRNQIQEHFLASKQPSEVETANEERHIIIFHCEFSSQRGPEMCRYLRECDRKVNDYPALFYPELYVLFGGYKSFFEQYEGHCDPQVYLPMDNPENLDECRFYKSMSKTDVGIGRHNSKKGKVPLARHPSTKKLCLD